MAELTWQGHRPPQLKPTGGCIVTRRADGALYIDKADPRIIISAELLDQIECGETVPDAVLDGDVLKVHGINRTVIYRIGEKVPDMLAYYAEWPD